LQARNLCLHLSSAHDIHQQVVIPDALLEERAGVRYRADPGGWKDPIQCPYPGCPGVLSSPYMLRRHFWDLHPKDTMHIPTSEVALCPLLPWYCVKSSWNVWFRDYQHVFHLEKVFFIWEKLTSTWNHLVSNSLSDLSHFWMASHVPQEMSDKWSLFSTNIWDSLVPFSYCT
jgi:hypothetical protein